LLKICLKVTLVAHVQGVSMCVIVISFLWLRASRSQKDCNNGEIIAAKIDGEATVKTFSRKNGQIWLLPANDNFAPIDGNNCEILGKVTAVMRSVR
jgi:SOS-response transcriptional repressor LexA